MDKRQHPARHQAPMRRIVVPASRHRLNVAPRQAQLAADKPRVVVQAAAKDLKPSPQPSKATPHTSKPKPKRVTMDSFSPTQATPNPPPTNLPPPISHPPTYQHPPQYQPVAAHPVQSIQYHTHYYAQPAQLPRPVYQQPYPMPQPSQYARAVATAQQQPQLPMPITPQYPAVVSGAAALPAVPKPKSSKVKPYADSMKRGLSKVKHRMNKPEMKYKPSDIVRYAVVTFFVIMASYLAFDTWSTNQKIQTVVGGDSASASNSQHEASADVENPPITSGVAYADYTVAGDMPRILTISSINLTARVSEVGLTNANKIDVPNDASFAGWYNGSAKLNTIGASFLTGHYNGVDAGGIFDNLNKVNLGDKISIEMGDGAKLNYEVVNIENLPVSQVDMSRALSPSDGVMEGLNIMTCQGSWSASGFTHRLTVYSKRV